jgi:hypothetical protein
VIVEMMIMMLGSNSRRFAVTYLEPFLKNGLFYNFVYNIFFINILYKMARRNYPKTLKKRMKGGYSVVCCDREYQIEKEEENKKTIEKNARIKVKNDIINAQNDIIKTKNKSVRFYKSSLKQPIAYEELKPITCEWEFDESDRQSTSNECSPRHGEKTKQYICPNKYPNEYNFENVDKNIKEKFIKYEGPENELRKPRKTEFRYDPWDRYDNPLKSDIIRDCKQVPMNRKPYGSEDPRSTSSGYSTNATFGSTLSSNAFFNSFSGYGKKKKTKKQKPSKKRKTNKKK